MIVSTVVNVQMPAMSLTLTAPYLIKQHVKILRFVIQAFSTYCADKINI